jgi:MSHA biogenesis protein MshL
MKFIVSLILVFIAACSSKPEYKVVEDALQDIQVKKPELIVPENAYDALTPELNSQRLAPDRFDVVAKSNTPKAFFMGLVDGMGINMLVHPDVRGRITLRLKSVTLEETLQAVRDLYGYQYLKTNYGYRILPKALQNKVFHVNYLNVSRQGQSGLTVSGGSIRDGDYSSSDSDSSNSGTSNSSSGSSSSSSVQTQASTDFWSKLQNSVALIVGNGEGRRVIVDAQAGLVMVKAFPMELAAVEDYLSKAELSLQKQVIIEAKILEVTLSKGFQSGIQWDTFGLGVGGTFAASSNEVAGSITSEQIINEDSLAGIFSLSFNGSDFTGAIQLLQRQGEVQVLSSPRISTVNNQKAVIKVGTDEFFITEISTTTNTSNDVTTTTPEVSLTPFFSGIALDVTPQIGEDNDVILHVHPSVTEVEERNKIFTYGNDTYNLPVALSSIRETDSIIRAKSGQVVVIGGLLQDKKSNIDASVPWLSSIPILGHLFKQTQKNSTKSELVILLQPKIVEPSSWLEEVEKVKSTFPKWRKQGALEDGE